MTATNFVRSIAGASSHEREAAALAALLAGNVPCYMRDFVDVTIAFAGHKLVMRVLPDHLTIGTDDDRLRMPLWPLTAQKVADVWNCVLPTTKMVNLIWHAAPSKLAPQPWGPPYDASMVSTDRFVAHNARIEATIKKLGVDATLLMSGHKKDVVLSKALAGRPTQVAIFGWIQPNGRPIQPLTLVHENTYGDYSHGIRMVSRECLLDDKPDDLGRILMDPHLCVGVSDEGPLPFIRQPGVH